MKGPFAELTRYLGWKDRFLEDYGYRGCKITQSSTLYDRALAFLFYALGKLFVPLLLHERVVKSQGFKALSIKDQEKAILEELDIIWENHLIRILHILPYLQLK